MLHDAGSWHFEFNALAGSIRQRLLRVAEVGAEGFECVLMQGSGTFGVESVIGSVIPPDGKLLVLSNGAYGERLAQIAAVVKIAHKALRCGEETTFDPRDVDSLLKEDPAITHVAIVHSETTTGILNPLEEIGGIVSSHGRTFVVDAMSSFGAVPIDFENSHIDYLVSSANKCIEGVPGFSFVIARRAKLLATQGWARSLSLDLLGQLRGFEKNGQFRYTPPTHAVLAFDQALKEFELEGGLAGRAARYKRNHETLLAGMKDLGFKPYLSPAVQSYIITSFHYPADPKFTFQEFYRRLSEKGFIIYPGKLTQVDLFRIGNIGRLFEADMQALVSAVKQVLAEMGVEIPKA